MSAEACRAIIENSPVIERASRLDEAYPGCYCEAWSLTASGGRGLAEEALVARIVTAPYDYDEAARTILTARLTALYSMGLSVVSEGASDQEIVQTVENLLGNAAEQRHLVGAVVMSAGSFRQFANDDDKARWFAIYATDDRGKSNHADVFGTRCSKGQQSKRRQKLAEKMLAHLVHADDVKVLIERLRACGI